MDNDSATVKRHIRTFAGDMEISKKMETSPSPSPSPLIPKQEESIAVPSIPESVVSPTFVFDSSPIPVPKLSKPSPLETYENDFSERMKETNASPVTVLAAEQNAGRSTSQSKQKSKVGAIFLFAGVILLIVGGIGIYLAYSYLTSVPTDSIFVPEISAPIFVDESEQISGTGIVLLRSIKQSLGRPLAPGAVRFLFTANATTSKNSIFSALQLPAPNILLRNIVAKNSMAGIINTNDPLDPVGASNQSPFFILSVESYSNSFSGMLTWERTMPNNMNQLFLPYDIASTTATTTAGFRDEVVNNHDVRIYRDMADRSVLLYGYWNQTTLVIARDPTAFDEIIDRLANSRTQ